MRWPFTLLIVGALACLILFAVAQRNPDSDVCNFCSGSGQGADCPRHDMAARDECLASVHSHYCGQRPEQCD